MKTDPETLKKLLALGKPGKRTNIGVLMGTPVPLPRKMPEKDFTKLVGEFAQACGWHVLHIRKILAAQKRKGGFKFHYETPTMFNGVGFPDLLMLRDTRQIIAELKTGYNTAEPEQAVWLEKFRASLKAEVHEWEPPDWPEIVLTLK